MTPHDDGMRLKRDVGILAVLVALHELLAYLLGGDVVVSALFAPQGIRALGLLAVALLFVVLRVVLFVGVPGWLGAVLFEAVFRAVVARRAPRLPVSDSAPAG
jgi:hypothetical protein